MLYCQKSALKIWQIISVGRIRLVQASCFPLKNIARCSFKSSRIKCFNIQFPNISSSCLDNYAGLLAQVFVLGILNASWRFFMNHNGIRDFDLLFVAVDSSSAVQQHPLLIVYDTLTSSCRRFVRILIKTQTKEYQIIRVVLSKCFDWIHTIHAAFLSD